MSMARTARRIRKYHANGWAHLPPKKRPRYSRTAGGEAENRTKQQKK